MLNAPISTPSVSVRFITNRPWEDLLSLYRSSATMKL